MRQNGSLIYWILATFTLLTLSEGCLKSKDPGLPTEVQEALNKAHLNKPELMKALLVFERPEDSLKKQALYFLIANLPQQYTSYASLFDSSGKKVTYNPLDFKSDAAIKQYLDSLSNYRGEIVYKIDSFTFDINKVTGTFLVQNVNAAFHAWKDNPFANNYSKHDFFHWILPYRVDNEPISDFRPHFIAKFGHSIPTHASVRQAALAINRLINDEITCDNRYIRNPVLKTYAQLEQEGAGSSQEIALYKVSAFRSLGLAATMDYCPFYSDSVNGVFTTTVFMPDGTELRFSSGVEKNPYPIHKTAKVYRRVFDRVPGCLFDIKKTSDHTPPFLGHYHYQDVSHLYIPTTNIRLKTTTGSGKYMYLSVFNDNKWKPIQWGIPDSSGTVVFTQMGTGQRYRLAKVKDKKVELCDLPFWSEEMK